MADYYKILGLNRSATNDDVKKAYRKLVLVWHPDKNPSTKKLEAEKMFKKILNAYEILTDPQKRQEYDTEQALNYDNQRDFAFIQEMDALLFWSDELGKKINRMLEDISFWRDKLEKKINQLIEDDRVWHEKVDYYNPWEVQRNAMMDYYNKWDGNRNATMDYYNNIISSNRYQRPMNSSLNPTSASFFTSTMPKESLNYSHVNVAPWDSFRLWCDELEKKILQTRQDIRIRRDKHEEQIRQIREDDRVQRGKLEVDAQERTRQWKLESQERMRILNFESKEKMQQLNLETQSLEKQLNDLGLYKM